jgi:hypothetical protein
MPQCCLISLQAGLYLLRRGLLWDHCDDGPQKTSAPVDAANTDSVLNLTRVSVTKDLVARDSIPSEVSSVVLVFAGINSPVIEY